MRTTSIVGIGIALLSLAAAPAARAETTAQHFTRLEKVLAEADRHRADMVRQLTDLKRDNQDLIEEVKKAHLFAKELKKDYDQLKKAYGIMETVYDKLNDTAGKAEELAAANKRIQEEEKTRIKNHMTESDTSFRKVADERRKVYEFVTKEVAKLTKRIETIEKQHRTDLENAKKERDALKKELQTVKDSIDKGDEALAQRLGSDDKFVRTLSATLERSAFMKTLAEKLPRDKTFLGGVIRSSDFQKSMAYNLSKSHLAYFVAALLKDDRFNKGVEYNLYKSDRYVKASADALVKTPNLVNGLIADYKFKQSMANELAKPDMLKPIAYQLSRDDTFFNHLANNSSFTGKLAKSSSFVDYLANNSSFASKLKPKLSR